jgi:hypothetical protein
LEGEASRLGRRLAAFLADLIRCCGGLFATTSTARSKRAHASERNPSSFFGSVPAMSVSTEHQRTVRTSYCNLMFEVRHRIDFTLRLCDDKYKLPEQPACKLGYLQLRLICETIALACLAVHGDAPGTRSAKIRSAHEADYILNALERLHSDFYPQPGVPINNPHIGGRSFIPSTVAYMTKSELLKLYRDCGERLHRGNYEEARKYRDIDIKPIRGATLKIIELLKFHKISFLGSEDEMWVIMTDPATGKVSATLERPIRP